MAAFAAKTAVADAAAAAPALARPPELSDDDYCAEVFRQKPKAADAILDSLIAKAGKLGISVSRPSTSLSSDDHERDRDRHASGAESAITVGTSHARTLSTGSEASASTTLTSHSSENEHSDSNGGMLSRTRSRGLTFAQYEKYLDQIRPNLSQPKFIPPPPPEPDAATSLFSVSTRRSLLSIKSSLAKMRRKKKNAPLFPEPTILSCSACREDFKPGQNLEKLPCGHTYCGRCLRIMISQSSTEETKMPPRCCTQPIPSTTIKTVLSRDEQTKFLRAVQQFSTPWEARIFCSNPTCGEFIPPRNKIDPKRPFQVTCRKCRTCVCIMCKKNAHPLGQDCSNDSDLDAVLQMGEKSGWRRCYKCRTLVELAQGCTHITCRCRAQFCYICGAVWDPAVGCPNFCNGDAEMERRRQEQEARIAALEAEEAVKEAAQAEAAAVRAAALVRTKGSPEFKVLRADQTLEMERFITFERKSKWLMWSRHAQQKLALTEKHNGAIEKMKERHAKTTANLEDRQVSAEMELRSTLEQSERNVRTRLKHMERYCEGLGRSPDPDMPQRTVTERDLRELGQQYNVEKNMKQLHEAKINVMRDRQTKALEDLNERQGSEMERLLKKNQQEVENLESVFTDEEDSLATIFSERRDKLRRRWELTAEILRKELETKHDASFAPMELPVWLGDDQESPNEALPAVSEE